MHQAFRESGITRADLARQAELPYAIVHGLMEGDRDIRVSSAVKIAKVLGLTLLKDKRRRCK